MPAKLKVAVLGSTGYSGLELTRLLLRHPQVDKPVLLSRPNEKEISHSVNLADMFPVLSGNGRYPLQPLSWAALKQQGIELLFLATPHEASRSIVPDAIAKWPESHRSERGLAAQGGTAPRHLWLQR